MPVGIGSKSFIQYGVEATYGTPVASKGYRLELISANIDPVIGSIPSASLYSGQSRRSIVQGGLYYQGKIVMEGRYYGMGRLLRGLFGSVATAGGPTYTHTYTESATPPSLTIELSEGDMPSTKVKQAVGCIVTDLTLDCTAGQSEAAQVRVEFGIVAKTVNLNVTPTSLSGTLVVPSTAQSNPWVFHQSTSTTNDGSGETQANQRTRSVKLTMSNPYALDRFFFGSLTPDQPIRSDFMTVQWEFTSDFIGTAALTAVPAWTTTSPSLQMTSGTDIVHFRSLEAKITNYGNPVEGYGPMLMNITHEAFRSGSNGDSSALYCRITNGDDAATNGDTGSP